MNLFGIIKYEGVNNTFDSFNNVLQKITDSKKQNSKNNGLSKINGSISQALDSRQTDVNNYEKILKDSRKGDTYYYNDVINQTKIVEDADNIINSIDVIDYSKVKTGMDKCLENCKGGCYAIGYNGVATCYPLPNKSFQWGTLYKNPMFTHK